MVYMYADDKECRFYFPEFKERTKLKRLVKAEAEENQVRPSFRYYCDIAFPPKHTESAGTPGRKSLETKYVTPINPCTLPNCAHMLNVLGGLPFNSFQRSSYRPSILERISVRFSLRENCQNKEVRIN